HPSRATAPRREPPGEAGGPEPVGTLRAMFNVGGMELIVIGVVALVVLGPDKLPGAMRQLGTFAGEMRRISRGFQTDLRSALDEAERDAERERLAADQAARGSAPATNEAAGTAPDPGAAMAA